MKYTFNKSDYKRLLGLTLHTDDELEDYIIEHYNSPTEITISDEEITFKTKKVRAPEKAKYDRLLKSYKDYKYKDAIEIGLDILEHSPNNKEICQILISCFIEENDSDMAMKYAFIALRSNLKDPISLASTGLLVFFKNDLNAAMTYWNDIYNSNHINSLEMIVENLIINGHYQDSIPFLEKILKITSNNAEILYYLSFCYYKSYDFNKSITYLKMCLRSGPDEQVSKLALDLYLELKVYDCLSI